jgi:ribosomal protein L17
VSDWGTLFLGIIAAATLLMALLQVGAVVAAARLAKRVERLAEELQRDVKPLIARAHVIAEDAQRAAAVAAAQVERVDALMTDLSRRVDETAGVLQNALVRPAREGMAIIAGLKAGFEMLRGRRSAATSASGRFDEEDALFIG